MSGPDPASWGIAAGHHHVHGEWVPAPAKGVAAALAAMGADDEAPAQPRSWVVTVDEEVRLPEPAVVVTEDGERAEVEEGLLPGLPPGYHRLEFADRQVGLIVSPGRCVLPAARMWGWAVQLYAARSTASWGIGDLGDLRRLAVWAGEDGADLLLINPLHAAAPTVPQQASPYYPTSRRWRNPIYLRIEDVPGAGRWRVARSSAWPRPAASSAGDAPSTATPCGS